MPGMRNRRGDEQQRFTFLPMTEALVSAAELEVGGDDTRSDPESGLDVQSLCRLALDVLAGAGIDAGRLDLHFVDEEVMADLNQEHMGHSGPTDVLSFPLELDAADIGPTMLGDIVVCPAVVTRQAAEHVGSVDGEFQLLVIHGVLHVLGHDHVEPEETLAMQRRERHYLASVGVEHPDAAPR